MIIVVVTLVAIVATFARYWLSLQQSYWARRHIPHDPTGVIQRKQHHVVSQTKIYQRCKAAGHRYYGIYRFYAPILIVCDMELVKRVLVADFESFRDRGLYHNTGSDPLTKNLFRLEGDAWRQMRLKMTPTFTSGKMKYMFPSIVSVAKRLIMVLGEEVDKANGKYECDIRPLMACYTTDVIGNCAFGLECNSLRDPNTEFRLMGNKAFASYHPLVEALGAKYRRLFNFFGVRCFPKVLYDFYEKIVADNIRFREKEKLRRNDFFDILLDMKNGKAEDGTEASLTLEEMVAQVFVFFAGGFETSSSTLGFCLYELSLNAELQQKARSDVLASLRKNSGEFSYESVKDMRYLEQVFMETLRKYPLATYLKRVATRDYQIPDSTHVIEKDTSVLIPVYAIQHDADIYAQPESFDPERFTPAARQQRHPMAELGFGAGPRVCIAERFGKMQTLIGLAHLLQHFQFSPSPIMLQHPEFDLKVRSLSFTNGVRLLVERV